MDARQRCFSGPPRTEARRGPAATAPSRERVRAVKQPCRRAMEPITNIDDPLYVKAMSHPLRVRILAMLDERTASPVELAGWLGASLGAVACDVRTPERTGLVELVWERA